MNYSHIRSTEKSRLGNYDLLRIISMFAVILLHINARYLSLGADISCSDIENLINIITRFSVPCFVMLSGAFNLNKNQNKYFLQFYKKAFINIVFPFLLALFILFSLSFIKSCIAGSGIWYLFESILIGDFSNLWYMFMLCGLYFFTPFIIIVKENIPRRAFFIGSFVWLAFSILFQSTSSYLVSYSFGNVFSYMGYYLVGNVLFEASQKHHRKWTGIFFLASIILFVVTFFLRRKFSISLYMFNPYTSFFSPTIVVASVFLFWGVSNTKINRSFGQLPQLCFFIYLFHTFIYLRLLSALGDKVLFNEITTIVLVSFVTFVISLLIANVYKTIIECIEKKFLFADK